MDPFWGCRSLVFVEHDAKKLNIESCPGTITAGELPVRLDLWDTDTTQLSSIGWDGYTD
jgi:hypothetical protein